MQINILHLYPDLLNLYGDKGNICTLTKRLEWRGIEANTLSVNEDLSLESCDVLYLGGGGEREEAEVLKKLIPFKDSLKAYAENGGVIIASCGGFELLGKLEILDIEISSSDKRLIGNVVLECEIDGESFTLSGFENHAERVDIKSHSPLGRVISGNGNNQNGFEGVLYKNVFATHLHGPILPKSPKLCDIILSRVLKKKYEDFDNLKPLDDNFEQIALKEIEKKVLEK